MISTLHMVGLALFFLVAHVAAAAWALSLVYPRLQAPAFKYLFSRGILLVALLALPLPLYAYHLEPPSLSNFLSLGGWSLYGVFVSLAWLGALVTAAKRYVRNGRGAQRLFWEAPARRILHDYRPPPEARDLKALLLGRLYTNIYRPVVREVVVPVPQLPRPLSGLKILHITDTHMAKRCGIHFYDAVSQALEKWEFHLVIHTGDLLSLNDQAEAASRWLGELGKRSTYGAYCVLGNHDLFLDTRRSNVALRKRGVRRLSHSWVEIFHKKKRVVLVGSESPWEQGDESATLAAALEREDADVVLGLAHAPSAALKLLRGGAQLALCGHTHGGQIRFGRLGPPLVTALHGGRYPHGLYEAAGGSLLVSAGLGSYIPPGRLLCPPEVLSITICRAP